MKINRKEGRHYLWPFSLMSLFRKAILYFCVGAIVGALGVQFAPLNIDVQMQTKEKGFLQIFVDNGAGFDELQSKRIALSDSKGFSHYQTFIPANGLRAIRIDPLETKGQFKLSNLNVNYLFWHHELNYFVPMHEVVVKSVDGAVLFAQATGNDPYLVITDVLYVKHWQLVATVFSAILGGVVAFFILAFTRYSNALIIMKNFSFKIDCISASIGLLVLSLLLAMVAIAMHSPGHVSFDTSVQLYEAYIGKSVSYHPPFMSALMKWLGGGEVATAFIVMICSLLIYVSMGYVAASILRNQAILGNFKIEVWRIAICALLLLNPVIFVYVGIVWKDVLFASVLSAATALSFAAAVLTVRRGLLLVIFAVVLLAISMQVRQQGVFMAPVLLLLPIVATVGSRSWSCKRQILVAIALVGVFLISLSITKSLVANSITGAGNKSTSEGLSFVMNYDIGGIIARSKTKTESLPIIISEVQRVAISHAYSGYRGDFLVLDPVASAYFSFTDEQRKRVWSTLAYEEPRAFVKHKWDAFESLLDLNGIQSCLPTHVGVYGNHDYLRLVGITEAVDARDHILYEIAYKFFDWPIYRHWFYLLMLIAVVAVIAVTRLPLRLKAMCMVTSLATGLFYLSFLPTTIACDFRYLFTGIPLITVLWIVLLTGRIPRQLPTPTQKIDSRNELNE